MLQRIYGTAWFTKEDLEAYLRRLEEARKRDHRVLGKQFDLFSIQEDVGPGLIFWHPKGAMMQFQLRRFIEDVILERGYQLVYTPNVTREELFLRSGHLPLYAENQFPAMAAGEGEAEGVRYRVKPVNCPMHILIYASQQRSYRDLPIRLAEIANVYRNERSGTLHGMLRVRGLTMDDAHLFLRPDQIEDEIFQLLDIVELVLGKTFGLSYRLDLATRPAKKLGSDASWAQAERAREQVRGLPIADTRPPEAQGVQRGLAAAGLRAVVDERNETLNYKIRDGETHKVPYMAVVGQREADAGTVAVRSRGEGKKQVILPVDDFVEKLREEVRGRGLTQLARGRR